MFGSLGGPEIIFIFVLATVFLKEGITIRRLMAIGLAAAGALLVAY